MQLIITLRKEVATSEQGNTLLQTVKTKLEDQPDIIVTGTIHESLTLPAEPE